MLRRTFLLTCLLLSSVGFSTTTQGEELEKTADTAVQSGATQKPLVQIAILLDNSGSMRGLINQARSELWKVVNEFVTARQNEQHPDLQVALYHYGQPPATKLIDFTDDLDKVSEMLFAIQISGGSEYCGQVIQRATDELAWSTNPRDLKVIFIAGNEPFTQGPVDYRVACKAAIAKGIMVNTIHCGNGIPEDWRDGALLADGKSMNINHNQAVVHIPAPQDKQIAELGVALNKTYLAYGANGADGLRRQAMQDSNASQASPASLQQRALAKANHLYRNANWDLIDAVRENKIDLATVKAESLPEAMRAMTVAERRAYVEKLQGDRAKLQTQINELNAARVKFVAEKQKEAAAEAAGKTLDQALIGAIREQATQKQFQFEKP